MDFSKIAKKIFSKKWMGGLNEFEVRDFLHVLAEQLRQLQQENLLLKKDLQDRENLIKSYKDREHILKESISNAENWAQKIKQEAESRRQLVLEKAQSDSENLIESARQSLQSVYSDIADLKRLQLQFKTGLKAALQVQLDLLENDSVFNPGLLANREEKDNLLESESSSAESSSESLKTPESLSQTDLSTDENIVTHSHTKTKAGSHNKKDSPLDTEPAEINSLRKSLNSLNKNFS